MLSISVLRFWEWWGGEPPPSPEQDYRQILEQQELKPDVISEVRTDKLIVKP